MCSGRLRQNLMLSSPIILLILVNLVWNLLFVGILRNFQRSSLVENLFLVILYAILLPLICCVKVLIWPISSSWWDTPSYLPLLSIFIMTELLSDPLLVKYLVMSPLLRYFHIESWDSSLRYSLDSLLSLRRCIGSPSHSYRILIDPGSFVYFIGISYSMLLLSWISLLS